MSSAVHKHMTQRMRECIEGKCEHMLQIINTQLIVSDSSMHVSRGQGRMLRSSCLRKSEFGAEFHLWEPENQHGRRHCTLNKTFPKRIVTHRRLESTTTSYIVISQSFTANLLQIFS